MLHTLLTPKFSSVSLYYDLTFLSYGPIFGKVHRMTSNYFDTVKVKNTNMHATYTPEAELFVRFTAQFSNVNFRKVHQMTPNYLDMVALSISYEGVSKSYVGLIISYVGVNKSYVGVIKSYVGLSKSFVGLLSPT